MQKWLNCQMGRPRIEYIFQEVQNSWKSLDSPAHIIKRFPLPQEYSSALNNVYESKRFNKSVKFNLICTHSFEQNVLTYTFQTLK